MTLDKMIRTCKAIRLLRLAQGGGVGIRVSHVAWWLGESKSQAYRDLLKLEKLGMVVRVEQPYKNNKAIDWFLSDRGFSLSRTENFLE